MPLPVVLTDATHGAMPHFELVTVRIRDTDGATGLGYSYAVNSGAEAFAVLIDRYLAPVIIGADVDRTGQSWQRMWCALHYARGGRATSAISAVDIAVWDVAPGVQVSRCGATSAA